MEEKRHDEVESLAAFLHSGGSEPAEKPKSEPKPRPAPERKSTPETKPASTGDSLNDILFSIDKKRGETKLKYTEEPKDEAEDTPAEYIESGKSDSLLNFDPDEDNGRYDDGATRMIDVISPPSKKTNTAAEITEREAEDEEEAKRENREIREMRIRYEKQRQHARTFACILIAAFLCVGILAASVYLSRHIVTFALDLTGIVTNEFRIDVIIPENADTETVAAILGENNIISSPKFFTEFGRLTGKSDSFIPGTYTLSSTMSYMTIFSTLQNEVHEDKTVIIQISEGMTAREIAVLLEENHVCFAEDFEIYYKNIQNNFDFEKRLSESSSKYNQMEGYLFPDTYEFYVIQAMEEQNLSSEDSEKMYKNSVKNAEEAAGKIYANFDDKITRSMYKKMGEMNLTLDEVITLASMVQKEAANTEDMYYVASVFLNRIRNSESYPKLESDVTVLFVENEIKPYLTGNSARYNRLAAAYSTYECNGIPAGPICNPGLDAIDAVLNAAETNYFYFCANEETGEVFYAETLAQHEENLILAGLA